MWNVKIGTESAQFLFWEYINSNFAVWGVGGDVRSNSSTTHHHQHNFSADMWIFHLMTTLPLFFVNSFVYQRDTVLF